MARIAKYFLILAVAGGLAACAGAPPPAPPEPTVVEVRISADDGINLGSAGDGLPIPVRLYRMSASEAFDAASYEQIYKQEMPTLGPYLVGVTEFVLFPGQSEVITRRFNERERHFGIVASYKNGVPNWRASTSIPPNETTTLLIRLGADGVTMEKL